MHGRHAVLVLVGGLLVLPGCGRDGNSRDRPQPREIADGIWDVDWVAGGSVDDTLLLQPWRVAADDSTVYVVDKGARRVTAFSAIDGTPRWITGRQGGGPGEFELPTALAISADGSIWVGDADNARITRLARDGTLLSEQPITEEHYVSGLCPLGDTTMLATFHAGGTRVQRMSAVGETVATYAFPWEDLADKSFLLTQGTLAGDGRGKCAYALTLGLGFAVFDLRNRSFGTPHRYVEPIGMPDVVRDVSPDGSRRSERLDSHQVAAHGAVLHSDTLIVAFQGTTELRDHVLDRYRASDGQYLNSVRTPWGLRDKGIARHGETYYFLSTRDGAPVLIAAHLGGQ